MSIDISVAAQIAGYILTIAAAFGGMYKAVKYCLSKYMDDKLAPVLKWTNNQQRDINEAAERDAILMEAQLASLEAIHQGKNNGNVDKAIEALHDYMLRRSHRPTSYSEK